MDVIISKKKTDGCIRLAVEYTLAGKQQSLWFEVPAEFEDDLTELADPFVIAVMFPAMQAGENIRVTNLPVSRALLRNLDQFQQAWVKWKPERYRPIMIDASPCAGPDHVQQGAVSAYTGGVDGAFVLYDNLIRPRTRCPYPIQALLYVQGFHVPLHHPLAADAVWASVRETAAAMGLTALGVRSNLRLAGHWHDMHGAAIAACLMLFQKRYGIGLLGSSHPFHYLRFPWGSNAVTDAMLSSGCMQIVNYGGGYNRVEKIQTLLPWKLFQRSANVCIRQFAGNCGRCEKCIRTQLAYLALGQAIPPAFPSAPSPWQVLGIVAYKPQELADYRSLYLTSKAHRAHRAIFVALRINIFVNSVLHAGLKAFGRTDLPPAGPLLRKLKKRLRLKKTFV